MKVFLRIALVSVLVVASLPLRGAWWPAVDDEGTVYVAGAYSVQALTPSGTKWRKSFSGIGQVIIVRDVLLLPSVQHSAPLNPDEPNIYYLTLYALNKADGQESWKSSWHRDGNKWSPYGAYAGVSVDLAGRALYDGLTFDVETGARLTNSATFFASADGVDLQGEPYWYSRAIGRDGTYYEGLMNAVRARDHRTGFQKWQTRLSGLVGEPVLGEDETVYVSDDTGTLYALDHRTGEIRWRNEPRYESVYLQSNRRSTAIALSSNQVAVLRYRPTNPIEVHRDLQSTLQTLDGKSGSVVGIFPANFVPYSLGNDEELYRARPMVVTPQGAIYVKDRGWISGQFSYGNSTWPRPSARNDNIASLARTGPPLILGQPQLEPALITNALPQFSVYASGTFPLNYQWLKNGEIIPGATNAVLEADAVAMADSYRVRVSNAEGEIMSAPVSAGIVPASLTIRQSVAGAVIEFHALTGSRYTLEKCMNLADLNWQSVTSVIGRNLPVQLPIQSTAPEFFRVSTVRD